MQFPQRLKAFAGIFIENKLACMRVNFFSKVNRSIQSERVTSSHPLTTQSTRHVFFTYFPRTHTLQPHAFRYLAHNNQLKHLSPQMLLGIVRMNSGTNT